MDVYVLGKKNDDHDQLLAHGGHVNEQEWELVGSRRVYSENEAGVRLADAVRGFDGKDPAELLLALPRIVKGLGKLAPMVAGEIDTLRLACLHAQAVRERTLKNGRFDSRYEDLRLVIKD